MNYQVEVIKSWSKLEELKQVWESLVEKDTYSTLFQTFSWHLAWWQAFGHLYQLHVLIAKQDDKIVGIAPLMIDQNKKLEFLGSTETEYQNFLTYPEHLEVLEVFVQEIFKLKDEYKIQLWEIPEVTPLSFVIKQLLEQQNIPFTCETTHSFQARISKRLNKSDVRYRCSKLKKLGQIECCSVIEDYKHQLFLLDTFFSWLKERFAHSLSRYRKRQLSVEYKNFCINLIRNFPPNTDKPYVHLVELTLNDEVIAIDKTIRCDNMIYGILQSYDPRFYNYSPGSILLQSSLNKWLEDGVVVNDFLRGDEGYKMRFVNTSLSLLRFTLYSSNLEKQTAKLKSNLLQLIKPFVFGLYEQIQKLKSIRPQQLIKKVVFGLIWYSGIAQIYQSLTKKRNRVLCYHSINDHPLANDLLTVSTRTFKNQVNYIKKLIDNNNSSTGKACKIKITFDDGYEDNYTNALPILQENDLKFTIFPTIKFIEQGFVPGWHSEPKYPALTWEQIQAMYKSELVEYGCHTMTHADLGKLSSDETRKELNESQAILINKLNLQSEICNLKLSYPYGKKENYNDKVKQIAKELGFEKAYTIEEGTNDKNADQYELKRLVIFDEPMYMFKVRVSGILDDILNIFKRA